MSEGFFQILKKGLQKFFANRVLILGVVLFAAAAVLLVRLFSLQFLHSEEYSESYMNTTRKEVSIPAQRGNIYDRNGVLLAGNEVVYSVTMTDWYYYTKQDGAFNEMLLRLIHLLARFGEEPKKTVPASIGDDGNYVFTGSAAKVRTFIRDVYGTKTIESLQEKGEDPYSYDAETVITYLMKTLYNFTSRWEGADQVSKEDALNICNIRYALAATSYTRYIETPIVENISDELQAAVLESQADLVGVHVEQAFKRVYYNSECFSSILGYVGSITTEEIDDLNALGGHYIAGDVIGKEGIESAYESYLQGTKGRKIIYVNSTGITLHEEIISEPEQGNDVYLSIDSDMTIAAYNVIEQRLAGIIVDHLYEKDDYDPMKAYQESNYQVPIRDVYFQMINNSILSIADFESDEACEAEKRMNSRMLAHKTELMNRFRRYLENREGTKLSEFDSYGQAYINYMYSFMVREGYLNTSAINTEDSVYTAWKAQECSFPDLLWHALSEGWIDMTKFSEEQRYNTVEACYGFMTEAILEEIAESYGDFDKLIYDELIHTNRISGCEIGLAMFRQGVLLEDTEWVSRLSENTSNATAYEFFSAKIKSMELLPGQIALDPCSAGLVLTDPNSGNLLAVVTYPGYDSNKINDSAYYMSLLADQSSPLYSRATQSRLAPGSTFKMITATAALEGGYLRPNERIKCEGIYDKLDHPRCWIYRSQSGEHGYLDLVHAIGQSCNCFFYECGYRFSLTGDGRYSPSQGLSVLRQYAEMYGFGALTGIEINENVSVISEDLPVTSAIGQGTHAFTTISLARYVTAIASRGNVYDFKLLREIRDRDDNILLSRAPEVKSTLSLQDSTWERIHEGMYTVVHEGGSRSTDFEDLRYDYAAKSGSAQENRLRPEHGWYVSYGPYDHIEYAMAVQIPNGYSSGNAALISKGLYEFLEGDITLEEILKASASSGGVNDIMD
ncbi:MAG: hypothetical protein IKS18_07410 [Lachnospiraceae bacterium]|nr:hypothetical protein [Lachnospiraceae bacterium]